MRRACKKKGRDMGQRTVATRRIYFKNRNRRVATKERPMPGYKAIIAVGGMACCGYPALVRGKERRENRQGRAKYKNARQPQRATRLYGLAFFFSPPIFPVSGWVFTTYKSSLVQFKERQVPMSQLPSFLFSAAISLGPCAISHHPAGVVVQFFSFGSFCAFLRLVSWACIPHQVAVSSGCCSVAFGGLPAGGL